VSATIVQRVVQPADQTRRADELLVAPATLVEICRHPTGQVGQAFAAALVDPEESRRAVERGRLKAAENLWLKSECACGGRRTSSPMRTTPSVIRPPVNGRSVHTIAVYAARAARA
jgi:hypothetical protein